jgi:hypothetical protein
MPVQRLKLAILPLDLSFSGLATHSEGNSNYWQVSLKEAENQVIKTKVIRVS